MFIYLFFLQFLGEQERSNGTSMGSNRRWFSQFKINLCDTWVEHFFSCIRLGFTEIITLLIKSGADIEKKDKKQETALMWGASSGEWFAFKNDSVCCFFGWKELIYFFCQ